MTHGLEAQVKILIVCSDPTVLKILTIGFQDNGLMFDYVSTGEEALRLLGTSLADYVIIDNNLHDITSLELARQIKKLGSCQILLLANFSELGETLEALDKFIDDYLLKPFSFEQVMVILKRFRKIDQLRREISIIN
ncbi:MAG: response regulator, partial [Candidatus Jordarchaeaceae archaeon]